MATPRRAVQARRIASGTASLIASVASLAPLAPFAVAEARQVTRAEQLDAVTVTGGRPSSLPLEIATTSESITRRQIDERINATDAEEVLQYFPGLIVRKRYIGDYDHAVLESRARRAPATARARWSTRTACCCRTCSATAPASRRAGGA